MLGWGISVYRESIYRSESDFLASWMTGLGGTDWLDQLVEDRRAMMICRAGGYPNRYAVELADFLAQLPQLPTPHQGPIVIGDDYVMPSGWRGTLEVNQAALQACKTYEVVIIDAWDQS
ncbi:hypothetical protein BH09VER1_BH09VER1_50730 [soil metagenome]